MIEGINDSAAAIIEGLQPFNNGGTSAPLYILHEIWKMDKHRLPAHVAQTVIAFQIHYILEDRTTHRITRDITGELENGAEVDRISYPDFYDPSKVQMCPVVAHLSLQFWKAGTATGKAVDELLTELLGFGELVFGALGATF